MEYVINAKQAKDIDSYTINKVGISSKELMFRAGNGIFKELNKYIYKNDRILIAAGKGGNAGDGYVLANLLNQNEFNVEVFEIDKFNEIKNEEVLFYKNEYLKNGGKFVDNLNQDYDIYIDAIFGSGLNKEVNGVYKDVIAILNYKKGVKISIDIPSGINGTTGDVMGIAFKCDLLFTIEFFKIGLLINKGRNYFNKAKVIRIGLCLDDDNYNYKLLKKVDFAGFFPKRDRISNKGTYGRVMLIGGSKEYLGSVILSQNAFSALRVGIGYSTLATPKSLVPLYALHYPEIMYKGLSDDNNGHLAFNEDELKGLLHQDAIAIGMGLGISDEVYKVIKYLLLNYKGTLIIDADGLNSLAKYGVDILKGHVCKVILTPHIKEFSRLIGREIRSTSLEVIDYLNDFARKYNVIVNLKSETSIISDGKECYFNISGNPGLAKGGSGDVLSGLTLGCVCQDGELIKKVALASFILGKASDFAVENINENSLVASDVINNISGVLNYLKR